MKFLKGCGGNQRLVFNMGEPESDGLTRYFQPQGTQPKSTYSGKGNQFSGFRLCHPIKVKFSHFFFPFFENFHFFLTTRVPVER
jgi:hypothetical protein